MSGIYLLIIFFLLFLSLPTPGMHVPYSILCAYKDRDLKQKKELEMAELEMANMVSYKNNALEDSKKNHLYSDTDTGNESDKSLVQNENKSNKEMKKSSRNDTNTGTKSNDANAASVSTRQSLRHVHNQTLLTHPCLQSHPTLHMHDVNNNSSNDGTAITESGNREVTTIGDTETLQARHERETDTTFVEKVNGESGKNEINVYTTTTVGSDDSSNSESCSIWTTIYDCSSSLVHSTEKDDSKYCSGYDYMCGVNTATGKEIDNLILMECEREGEWKEEDEAEEDEAESSSTHRPTFSVSLDDNKIKSENTSSNSNSNSSDSNSSNSNSSNSNSSSTLQTDKEIIQAKRHVVKAIANVRARVSANAAATAAKMQAQRGLLPKYCNESGAGTMDLSRNGFLQPLTHSLSRFQDSISLLQNNINEGIGQGDQERVQSVREKRNIPVANVQHRPEGVSAVEVPYDEGV
jgi:hypothetical protein